MNIIEARKSGKRFKRPCHQDWFSGMHTCSGGLMLGRYEKDCYNEPISDLYEEDILADDWVLNDK